MPYTIMHESQTDLVHVNQTSGGGNWQLLGNYSFNGSGNEYVEVSDSTGRTSADAVKFVRVGGGAVTTTVSYVHNDRLGTPLAMTDGTGSVVWRATHDPFGKADIDVSSSQSLHIRFPGQYFDVETGLHYNYFRYYDPETGRYITSDPIGLAGGINSFGYVGGNPTRWIDHLGLDSPGCDGVPDFLESDCMLNMCSKHDYCYFENRCSATSWMLPLSQCNLRCNLPAVGGTLCAAGSALTGRKCRIAPDLTPRDKTPPSIPVVPLSLQAPQGAELWEWEE